MNLESIIAEIDLQPKNVESLKKAADYLDLVEKKGREAKEGSLEWHKAMKESAILGKKLGKENKALAGSIDRMESDVKALSDAQRKLNLSTKQGQAEFKSYQRSIDKTNKKLKTYKSTTNDSVSSITSMAKKAGPALAGLFAVSELVSYGRELINVTAKFDSLEKTIDFASGGQIKGAKSMSFLNREIDYLGLNLESSIEGFKTFAGSLRGTKLSIEDARSTYSDVSTAVSAMNLSGEDAKGVYLALGQIMSKGTVQSEELRGQIGERIPGAFNIASKALGVTTKELNKMLEQGQVLSEDFLPKFSKQLREEFGGALDESTKSLRADLNRAENAWVRLQLAFGESNIPLIQNMVQLFTRSVDSMTKAFAKSEEEIFNNAKANQELGKSSQILLDRYKELTKDGVKPTSDEKLELTRIIGIMERGFGSSVVQIDKETGALKLNTKAVEQQIKQKMLLANQEAQGYYLQAQNSMKQIESTARASERIRQLLGNAEKELVSQGISVNDVIANAQLGVVVDRGTFSEQIDQMDELTDSQKELVKAVRDYRIETGRNDKESNKLTETYSKNIKALKKLGFDLNTFNVDIGSEDGEDLGITGGIGKSTKSKIQKSFSELMQEIEIARKKAKAEYLGDSSMGALIDFDAESQKIRIEYDKSVKNLLEIASSQNATEEEIGKAMSLIEGEFLDQIKILKGKLDKVVAEEGVKLKPIKVNLEIEQSELEKAKLPKKLEVPEDRQFNSEDLIDPDAIQEKLDRTKAAFNMFYDGLRQAVDSYFNHSINKINEEVNARESRINYLSRIQSASSEQALKEEEQRQAEALKKREQLARQQQILGSIETAANIAVGVSRVFAESGVASFGTIPAILGVLGVALAGIPQLIAPLFLKNGMIDIDGPGTSTSDSIPIMGSKGESMINATATRNSKQLLTGINEGRITDNMLMPRLPIIQYPKGNVISEHPKLAIQKAVDNSKLEKALNENNRLMIKMLNKPTEKTDLTLDAKGFSKFVRKTQAKADKIDKMR